MALQGDLGAPDDHARGAVATHRVKGDRDAFAHAMIPRAESG